MGPRTSSLLGIPQLNQRPPFQEDHLGGNGSAVRSQGQRDPRPSDSKLAITLMAKVSAIEAQGW
jgi:hypothetical protein